MQELKVYFNLLLVILSNNYFPVSSEILEGKKDSNSQKLLVVLLDGFRWDYYDRDKEHLDAFQQFLTEGVQAEWVEPVFPSISFPNWMTISTGLFPENHGFIGNYMVDRGEANNMVELKLEGHSPSDSRWWKSEPIWITATKNKQNVSLTSWGMCEVPFESVTPQYCTGYNGSQKLRKNLETALHRLENDCQLAMVHDDLIDVTGHRFGPDSYILKAAVQSVNSVLQEFYSNINMSHISDKLNVILVSDHGMTKSSPTRYVFLRNYVDKKYMHKALSSLSGGGFSAIAAIRTPGAVDELMKTLKLMPGVDAYRKEDIPEELHYKNNRLVFDILLLSKKGYTIVGLDNAELYSQFHQGVHGVYNSTDMRAIFFARGPAFKKGLVHPPIKMEDSYQVFANILGIEALPNNGSWARVKGMMRDE